MPLLELSVSTSVNGKKQLLKDLSAAVTKVSKKPEAYVAVKLEENAAIVFGGDADAPAAIARVSAIGGINSSANAALTAEICASLKQFAGVAPGRVYVVFQDVPAANWGYNSATFG
eukprot:TRINITY_DN24484_c0_g1_i1.p2 TRINITY_DN24484_c0_g1~~TRINITY_DN24484_c0_g1_i1.p2  ORF type:complete len:116 (-),score=36.82 TRINITY_DN24484_c0_g1_i1:121-468(-)